MAVGNDGTVSYLIFTLFHNENNLVMNNNGKNDKHIAFIPVWFSNCVIVLFILSLFSSCVKY